LTVDGLSRTLNDKLVQKRNFLHVLGVDLGGGKGKKTALATLRIDPQEGATVVEIAPRAGAAPLYDQALLTLLRGFGDDTLLAVDAPLTLPPCLRCRVSLCPGQRDCVDGGVMQMRRTVAAHDAALDRDGRRGKPSITPYTQRATEVHLLYERGMTPREALGQGTGPLAARAAHLVRALTDRFRLNENLIEVSPKATLTALGFTRPYKKHLLERETRAEVLEALSDELRFGPGVWRESCVQSDHLFDAVICAFTGYLWAKEGWQDQIAADGDGARPEDGWIWVPPAAPLAAPAASPEASPPTFARSGAGKN
jgi:hypothetical protein